MFCAKCNITYSSAKFCPTCGTTLIAPPSIAAPPAQAYAQPPQAYAQPPQTYAAAPQAPVINVQPQAPGSYAAVNSANPYQQSYAALPAKKKNLPLILSLSIGGVLLAVILSIVSYQAQLAAQVAAASASASAALDSEIRDALDSCDLSTSDSGVAMSGARQVTLSNGLLDSIYSTDIKCVLQALGADSDSIYNIFDSSDDSGTEYFGDAIATWSFGSSMWIVTIEIS